MGENRNQMQRAKGENGRTRQEKRKRGKRESRAREELREEHSHFQSVCDETNDNSTRYDWA